MQCLESTRKYVNLRSLFSSSARSRAMIDDFFGEKKSSVFFFFSHTHAWINTGSRTGTSQRVEVYDYKLELFSFYKNENESINYLLIRFFRVKNNK